MSYDRITGTSEECVAVKVSSFNTVTFNMVMNDAGALRAAVNPRYVALCRINKIDLDEHQHGITDRDLRRIEENLRCPSCYARVAIMAGNGLMFTNEGLSKMFAILELTT